jgi:hypothetical protein
VILELPPCSHTPCLPAPQNPNSFSVLLLSQYYFKKLNIFMPQRFPQRSIIFFRNPLAKVENFAFHSPTSKEEKFSFLDSRHITKFKLGFFRKRKDILHGIDN